MSSIPSSPVNDSRLSPFAYLIPGNLAAQKCLTSLVDREHDNQLPVELVADTPPQLDQEPGYDSSHRAARSKYQLSLSFQKHGTGHDGGWELGKGSARRSDAPIDLQLCSPKSRHLRGPVMATILINPRSGAFLLQNMSRKHSVVYLQADGGTDVELRYHDQHVLYRTSNHLRFGPFDYLLEFHVHNEVDFSRARNQYIREYIYHNIGDTESLCPLLDVLPKPTHLQIGGVILHRSISKGAFGVVRLGVHRRSGEVIACKTIHCQQREIASVKNEIILASEIPPTSVGVVPLLYTWCEHGQSPPCFSTTLEDVHLMMPFAPYDFNTAPWPDIPLATRLELFRQLLEGLQNIHAAGIMHRDISPRNSLIFSLRESSPRAAICDFGKSKRGVTGANTSLGPPPYIAPEVWTRRGYTNSIDVFSLGLTMLHTFQNWRGAGPIDKDGHDIVLERLASLREQGRVPESLEALLRAMLAWDPADRPTAAQALDNEVWGRLGPASCPASKRQSSDTGSQCGLAASGSGREKRVRRSDGQSPDSPPAGSSST